MDQYSGLHRPVSSKFSNFNAAKDAGADKIRYLPPGLDAGMIALDWSSIPLRAFKDYRAITCPFRDPNLPSYLAG